MLIVRLLVFTCTLTGALADYQCVCAYAVETQIYERPDTSAKNVGYMYEFDCKPAYHGLVAPHGWQPVETEHQVGYVQNSSTTELQVCQGSIPDEDRVTTTIPPTKLFTTTSTPTTTITPKLTTVTPKPTSTTLKPTTSTPKPSTIYLTPKPTTTPIPTTTSKKNTATTTTTPKPTTTTTMPKPITTTTTKRPTTIKITTTLKPTTTSTTTPRPTTTTTTRKPSTIQYIRQCPAAVLRRNQDLTYIYKHLSYCYEFRNQLQDWEHAKLDCQQNGGFLLSIQSQDETDFVLTMLNRLRKPQPIWLGLHDQAHEEQWQWVSGLPLKYTNWMLGSHHDKYHVFEDCALYVPARRGEWDDVHCTGLLLDRTASHPWICQYNVV